MNKNCKKIFASAVLISLVVTTVITTGTVKADVGKVTRLGAADRYSTSAQVAKANWTSGSNNVVLVSGEGYADAISASLLAKTLDAPILLTRSNTLSSDTKLALETLKPKNIYIIGGNASVFESVRNILKKSYNLIELAGKNRYETNAAVANELVSNHGISADNVMVVGGQNFSDALSVASIAAAKGEILLLADNNASDIKQQSNFIKANKSKVTLVGTKNVINNNIYSELRASNRVDGGFDRFDTNLKILNYYKSDLKNDKIYIANATGSGYADALVASALSGKYTAPLVLLDRESSQNTDNAISYIIKNVDKSKTDINVVGGIVVVPETIINMINININNSPQDDNNDNNSNKSGGSSSNGNSSDNNDDISVSLNKISDTLTVGDTDTLIATVSPTNAANEKVIWESSDKEIATVDSNGKVTAVSVGKVTITATTNNGSKKASCLITISAKDVEDLPFEIVGETDKDYFYLNNVGLTSWVSSYIEKFNNGLALVYDKDPNSDFKMSSPMEDILQNGKDYSDDFKAGFIDSTGKEVVIPKYNWATDFSDGLARVQLNGKWGYVDKTGREIIPLRYDWISTFSDGLAQVELDENGKYKYGYIDKTGREVVPAKYDSTSDFSGELAAVKLDGKWGYIDQTGKEVVTLRYDYVSNNFSEGLAVVELNGKWGYIDETGREVIPLELEYDWMSDFSEGLAVVKLNGKYGYVDKTGREVVPLRYDDVRVFSEGLGAVESSEKWGYIDEIGREVVPLRYDDVHIFSEGLAAVESNEKWGYIDETGREVIPLRYDWISDFSDGLAKVGLYENGKYKYGYIDKTGKEMIPVKYDDITIAGASDDFQEGLAAVEVNGKWGYVDKTGEEVVPLKYDGATDFSEGLAAIKSNGKWQIIKMKK